MAIAMAICALITVQKTREMKISLEDTLIFITVTIWSILLGGSFLYVFIAYSPNELFLYAKDGDFSFLKSGGLAFYGGLAGGILGGIVSAKKLRLRISLLERCVVPYVPLGHAIGKIGCLLAGCCYGVEYSGFFAVKRVLEETGKTYFPIQAVEAIFNVIIMAVLLAYIKKQRYRYDVLRLYLIMYSAARFFVEFFRWDGSRERFLALSISQYISFFIFCFCAAGYVIKYTRKYVNNKLKDAL